MDMLPRISKISRDVDKTPNEPNASWDFRRPPPSSRGRNRIKVVDEGRARARVSSWSVILMVEAPRDSGLGTPLPPCVDEKFIPSLWIQIEPLRFKVRARARPWDTDGRCVAPESSSFETNHSWPWDTRNGGSHSPGSLQRASRRLIA